MFSSKHREYSNVPYSGYYKFLKPAVNLRDADLIKDILIKDHFSFHVNEQQFDEKTDPLMILNPFGARGDVWRKGRTVLTPLLTLFKVHFMDVIILFFGFILTAHEFRYLNELLYWLCLLIHIGSNNIPIAYG